MSNPVEGTTWFSARKEALMALVIHCLTDDVFAVTAEDVPIFMSNDFDEALTIAEALVLSEFPEVEKK